MDAMTLQEQLDDVRVRLLESIAALPDEVLLEPNVVGQWSIADVLAHLVNWEAELVTALMRIDQGKRPTRLLNALADREAYNAARYEEVKGRDLDAIFDDLQGVRAKMEEWIEEFSEMELEDPDRYDWLEGQALWELIAETSFEHEAEHIPEIERFAERWLAENDEAEGEDIDDIEVSENGDRG